MIIGADCVQYMIYIDIFGWFESQLSSGVKLMVVNHIKSQLGGGRRRSLLEGLGAENFG